MKKPVILLISSCLIIGLLITSCSSAKPETSITTVTNSATEIIYTTTTAIATLTTTLTINNYPEICNQILSLLLKADGSNGDYTVVDPETRTGAELCNTDEEAKQFIIKIAKWFNSDVNYDFTDLATQLYEINFKYKYLTLESSIKDGYYVDYDGKFSQYFTKDGGGWEKWHQEHPEAHGSTSVSIPAYDPETGYVLVYIGTQYDWLMGTGGLYAFRYTNGTLIEIGYSGMWVS